VGKWETHQFGSCNNSCKQLIIVVYIKVFMLVFCITSSLHWKLFM